MNTTRIIESLSVNCFKQIIHKREHNIKIGGHATDRLSDAQREAFDENQLITPLIQENPRGVGLQRNGRYAVYYRRKTRYLKLILDIGDEGVEIVTFMYTLTMPNLKRLQ